MTIAERLIARLREAGLDLPEGSRLGRPRGMAYPRNRGHMARVYALLGMEFPTTFNDD